MKKTVLFLLLICLPVIGFSQNINGRFSSSVYSFERADNQATSYNYLRTFQTLQLNGNYGKFALRTRLNLEADVAKKLVNDPRMRFYNLYLEARDLWNVATIKVGRQSVFSGPITGLFDGVNLKLKYNKLKFTGYYGGNVPAYQKLELTKEFGKDYILGGKLDAYLMPELHLGAGYVKKNYLRENYFADRVDANYNPVNILIQNKSNKFNYVFGEADYIMANMFDAHVNYHYDLNFNTTSRVEFNGRYSQIENLGISLYYNYRAPKIRYNSIFAVFDFANTQEIEAGVDYKFMSKYTVFGKFGNVNYKDETSQRITLGINSPYGSLSYRKSLGYAGELDAVSFYTAKSFFDGLITPSIGLSYTTYKLSQDAEKNNLVSVLVGTNYRPLRNLSFDVQGQMFNNKIYKNDYRILFRLNHWFNANF